jgi:hypothetical protein
VLELRANPGPTGRLLREMLGAKGLLTGPARGVVNYGHGGPSNLPMLNKRAGTINKLQELQLLGEKGVRTVPFGGFRDFNSGLVMGRNVHHTRGTDIVVLRAGEGGPRRDFYTQLIPKRREFRVWAYRRTCIGVYEKVLTYPKKLGRKGRSREVWNWRNGYSYLFRRASEMPAELKLLGTRSVDALGLDFGAVDIIEGQDGQFYVLECNSAPGTEGPRQGLTSLVNHIEKWARNGFKKRNGEEDESRPADSGNRR